MNRYDDDTLRIEGVRREDRYLIRTGELGETVILAQDRITQTLAFMKERSYDRLEVNRTLGYPSPDLSPVTAFSFLTGFSLIHGPVDIAPFRGLPGLTQLAIRAHVIAPFDFACLPNLLACRLHWWPGAKSVFTCTGLKSLDLDYYKHKSIGPLREFNRIEHLGISNSPLEDLTAIAEMPPLRELELINLGKLSTLDALKPQTQLRRLEIDGSRKLTEISALAGMTQLRSLHLCNAGRIKSLKPLQKLQHLQQLFMWEDTNVQDGDMRVLLELPELRLVAFANRRHYTHTCEEISTELVNRHGRPLAER